MKDGSRVATSLSSILREVYYSTLLTSFPAYKSVIFGGDISNELGNEFALL